MTSRRSNGLWLNVEVSLSLLLTKFQLDLISFAICLIGLFMNKSSAASITQAI